MIFSKTFPVGGPGAVAAPDAIGYFWSRAIA
jgi:hypothetical protein